MNNTEHKLEIYCEMIEHQINEARISQLQFRSTSYLISHASFGFTQEQTLAINKAFSARIDIKSTIKKFAEDHGLGVIKDESIRREFIKQLVKMTKFPTMYPA